VPSHASPCNARRPFPLYKTGRAVIVNLVNGESAGITQIPARLRRCSLAKAPSWRSGKGLGGKGPSMPAHVDESDTQMSSAFFVAISAFLGFWYY
jgi:hypothetical protein